MFGHPLGANAPTRFTAAALAGYGVISTAGLLLFQMDVRGTVDSQRDTPHIVATILMSIFIVATMAFGIAPRSASESLGDAGQNRFPSVLDRPLRHLSALESTSCERPETVSRKTLLQIVLFLDAI